MDDTLHQPQSSVSMQFEQLKDDEQFDEETDTLVPAYVILTMPSAAMARVVEPSRSHDVMTSAAVVDQTTTCDEYRTSTVHCRVEFVRGCGASIIRNRSVGSMSVNAS